MGDRVTNTNYLVSKNKVGQPCIMIVQERIEGTTLKNLEKRKESDSYMGALKQMEEIETILSAQIEKDPELLQCYSIQD